MGLDPKPSAKQTDMWLAILADNFNGGSPYNSMFKCGYYGVPIDWIVEKCARNGIALRKKDIQAYNDGVFKHDVAGCYGSSEAVRIDRAMLEYGKPFEEVELSDFPMLPKGWRGSERRFFPCTSDNKPMQPWGWKKDADGKVTSPELYTRPDAAALSPCGWVGQNLLYQPFVVMDIDGRGHGQDDAEVIAFGMKYKDRTFSTEDPMKPGSFHLYFETDRLLPDKHFPWAKLDFKGNAKNSAVYFKNKIGNGMPMMRLDDEAWHAMLDYQKGRR